MRLRADDTGLKNASGRLSALRTVVNRLLGMSGYELTRPADTIAKLRRQARTSSAGWIVEFIGSEAIGKTTLQSALFKHLRKTWFFSFNLGQAGPAPEADQEIERLHREICLRFVQDLERRAPDPWRMVTLLRQKGMVLSESLTMLTHDFPRGFIVDEGLFKGFPCEVLDLASEGPDVLWRRRAFIHLRATSSEVAVSRYLGRMAERGGRNLPQTVPSEQDVRARVERDTQLFERLCEKADSFGCPVITLHAEVSTAENVRRVLEFESCLRHE